MLCSDLVLLGPNPVGPRILAKLRWTDDLGWAPEI
jgi:hypothetical protein